MKLVDVYSLCSLYNFDNFNSSHLLIFTYILNDTELMVSFHRLFPLLYAKITLIQGFDIKNVKGNCIGLLFLRLLYSLSLVLVLNED